MPKFLTISPSHIPGKKVEAWDRFRSGGYVAIGWMHEELAGLSLSQVESRIRAHQYDNESSALDAFRKLLSLRVGDYVAVNNANQGLFGIGIVTSGYQFHEHHHDSGIEDRQQWYSHYVTVDWQVVKYMRRRDLLKEGETGWQPYGTAGKVFDAVPDYILRALGEVVPDPNGPIDPVRPGWLVPVIDSIDHLRKDPAHQERAHESLVEDFLVALGYRKHQDIKYRQGRIDITVYANGKPTMLFEVKRDWDLNFTSSNVIRQAYGYAEEKGIRFVAITNGDYYMIFDRLKGLSYQTNAIGEITLSALQGDDIQVIERLRPQQMATVDVAELLRHVAEGFELVDET